MGTYRALAQEEIDTMVRAGCSAPDWSSVSVAAGFDPRRVRNSHFSGRVEIGALKGKVTLEAGVELPAEIADATLVGCTLGNDVRVNRVSTLANYRIGDGALVSDVGVMATRPGATFGNGVEAETINEGGGREIPIFAQMSSQFAYLLGLHRYRADLIAALRAMVQAYVEGTKADRGTVGAGAVVRQVAEVVDVQIGPAALVAGAHRLVNGTILSEPAAPTRVGAGVLAQDFVIGEGSSVKDGVVLNRSFVGQAVQLGKQFSAENSLFFANCEGFHGEACSIFAGPYSVTHHKSTLLIAGVYSFYNAGSGSNQSNHMYKLGPVHQGLLQRGCKTGSFSYLLWPSVVGPFSVVLGKHMTNIDTGELPFSYITEEHGESMLTPAMNMFTVGTVRDGEKWPARDRRTATDRRDQIRFEVYSPYMVHKMIRAEALLLDLYEKTPKDVEQVRYRGVTIKRLLLRHGTRNYASGIDMYLNGRILERTAAARSRGIGAVRQALADEGVYSEEWADVGGLLVGQHRLQALVDAIAQGRIANLAQFQQAFSEAGQAYAQDEWAWVRRAFAARTGKTVDELEMADLEALEAEYKKLTATSIKKILADAEKEFDPEAKVGYGADGDEAARQADFAAVRGSFAGNSFVRKMQEELAALS